MRVIERRSVLADLDATLDAAATGRGSLVFIAGEAGIGKTTLVTAFAARHAGVRTLTGACDNLSTPPPLGPLHDMADRTPAVAALLDVESRHELFVGFLDHVSTPGRPTIVVIEDVHWADTATLDLLRFVGRRAGRTTATVLATYRSDEVGRTHPLRAVLGDLATVGAVSRHTLVPLTADAVAELAASTGIDADALHRRTGGNPFFVTEVLAHPDTELPTTLRDAVLARASRLPVGARRVLDIASLVPGPVEPDLLRAVVDPAPRDVDACVDAGMLTADDRGHLLFRHELARLAIADAVLPARRRDLHARIVRALLEREGSAPARIAHHADAAGDGPTVLEHAVRAAEHATARGAHLQATNQLARAMRHADGLEPVRRAGLLERYAASSTVAVVGSWSDVQDVVDEAVSLRRELGDPHALGNALRIRATVYYNAGRSPEAYASIDEARDVLEPHGESAELCDALTEGLALAMLARRYDDAAELSGEAIDLAGRLDRRRALAAALDSTGSVELLTGRVDDGVAHLRRSIEVARSAGIDREVARALVNLGSGAGEVRRYDIAEPSLLEGIDYAGARDLDDYANYSSAWLARVRFETGRWAEAAGVLESLPLDDPDLSPITRITASTVLGRLRARRGDPGSEDALSDAWELAATTDDLQRLWPVAAARAEDALLDGREDDVAPLVRSTFELACELDHPWAVGELGALLWSVGALDDGRAAVEQRAAAPYGLRVAGELASAAAAWEELGCPYEQAEVLGEGDEDQQRRALELLDQLGAARTAGHLRQQMRAAGIRSIPRGPRAATAAHPAGLTPREAEVLDLVADGCTNAEIGEALFISAKTAGNHVSSILAKLGVRSRYEAAEVVDRLQATTHPTWGGHPHVPHGHRS